ncbi:ExeM/NucH family extracellular endonuclease [Synechococcus sp. BDU 130192]|uniref:ExeM/NucH family extracellular endonuclease n=1 Tax=Synechococcus sp. BDU 130192 TaxID=2042059 RepID=UPI000C07400A|nr:ExeM/NucH family extracellular endonuclease [Synechococcus sp. BDU 130192]
MTATILSAGDIAIIGFNFDNPDEFAFVPLIDLGAGTEINFTDNGWQAAGTFRSNEGTFTWTALTDVDAGTIINPVVSGISFSASGDQIIAYQGDASSPTFIYALNSEGNPGVWQSDSTNSNTSALPTGLVNGETAVALDEIDNAIYTGITTGTKAELLAAISNKSNWSGNDSTRQILPANAFSVSSISDDDPSPLTLISTIQGNGDVSPLEGELVTIEAVVVGDFQDGDAGTNGDFNGFFVQEEDADADGDAATSEGLFIFDGNSPIVDVNVGDIVRVTGTVNEFFGETQLSGVTVEVINDSDNSNQVTPATLTFPVAETVTNSDGALIADLEAYEGMLVTIPQELTVSDLFTLGRFGDVGLYADGRLETYTQTNMPSVDGFQAYQDLGIRNTVILDDGSTAQNPAVIPFEIPSEPGDAAGQLDANDDLNVGDTVTGLTGVVRFSRGSGGSGDEIYRINPVDTVEFVNTNPRPTEAPDVGGSLKVASFNVLNFFTSLGDENLTSGPDGLDPRGADNQEEFDRQVAKLVSALAEIEADVFGLVELENEFGDVNGDGEFAIGFLADALNAVIPGANYQYVDPGTDYVGTDAIAVGFIYNANTVGIAEGTTVAVLSDSDLAGLGVDPGNPIFDGSGTSRNPIAVTFEELATGETFTAVNNHFKSKGSVSPFGNNAGTGDGTGNNNEARLQAAIAVNAWLDTDPTGSGDSDFLILGDLNAYGMEDPIQYLLDEGYVDTIEKFLPDGESIYSFGFPLDLETSPQVQAFGALDYALANESLASQVVDTAEWHINADEASAFDYNTNFKPQAQIDGLFGANPFRSSDHDPLIIGLDLSSEPEVFTLELLHAADQEAGAAAVQDIPNFSAVLNALRAQDLGNDGIVDNTLTLSSGDAFIPGLFFDASAAAFGSGGIADIQIQNELGFQAIALGNHEFDFGTETLASLIDGSAPGSILGEDFTGANFPYLSANLDFSTDANLAPLAVVGGQAPQANVVTSSTVIDVNGEDIGVVGATTPTLDRISNSGDVGIFPSDFDLNPTPAQLDALAAEIQAEVDALLAANPDMNKVVLLSHMQQLNLERALAERLVNVDIIVGGGSNTRLFDENDRPRAGDSNQGDYPEFIDNAGGTKTALVNTDGSYKYVGRLVIDFDADGNIIPESYDPTVSGAYATDAQGVADLNAENLVDPEIQEIVNAIEAQILATESNVFGISDVFLNGNRSGLDTPEETDGVRTQETNLGNLTADANLAIAKEFDSEVVVSIKNGGGIRASIGQVVVPAGGTEAVRLPNEAVFDSDGNVVKPEGGISQNDIQAALAFNNGLTLLTLTKAELVAVLEHGVSLIPGVAGQFPQISGVKFSYDPDLAEGDRIISAGIFDENDDLIAELVRDGEIVGDANQTFRIVTLNFLASGGDGYPFPTGDSVNRVDLTDLDGDGQDDNQLTGDATFAADGTEQDALAEYLLDNFSTPETAFAQEDVGRTLDERIQNLNFRDDGVLGESTNGQVIFRAINLISSIFQRVLGPFGNNVNLGNILFSDEEGFEDSFDIFNTNLWQRILGNRNNTTSLNNLDNQMWGRNNSDDVMNALGGDDSEYGQSDDDILRGDRGNGILNGGIGDDILTGGKGLGTFVLNSGAGVNIITDFELGIDRIVLGNLSVNEVQLADTSTNTMMSASPSDLLGIFTDVQLSGFESEVFA